MSKLPLYVYLLAVLAAGLLAHQASADDTEVYVTTSTPSGTTAQPNVLFVFDTSGSMDAEITTKQDYNAVADYGSSDNNYYYIYEQDYDYVTSVHKDFVYCQALKTAIAGQPSNPVFNGRLARWQTKLWWQWWLTDGWNNVSSSSTFGASNPLECQADSGIHGADAASAAKYAANGSNGPYSTSSGNTIGWSSLNQLIVVSANYRDYLNDPDTSSTRRKIDIMKDAAKDLVDDFNGLNFGMMRYRSDGQGGYAVHHFQDITPAANKTSIKAAIDLLPATGTTPLAETLWEAARYYRGQSIDYGTASVAAAKSGSNYVSPMSHSCQKNHLVYLTDGEPVSDSGRDSQIRTLTGKTCSHTDYGTQANQTCLDEMAEWLKNTDHSSLTDKQDVTVHTIGFDISLDLLAVTAQKGGGSVYNASDADELKSAFNTIILNILSTETAFSAPAVTVNAYNNLQHREDLYYAIFKPIEKPRWPGNIKKYKVDANAVIRDVNGNAAIDPQTGFFKENARSYWSPGVDGHTVGIGGFASQMSGSRSIYTYTGAGAPSNADLTATANALLGSNAAVTNAMLGLDGSAPAEERDTLIRWARGEDVENVMPVGDIHQFIADPLHSRPLVITYGGTEASPDDTIFGGTNMGFLHAIAASNGAEQFAFIPRELLPNVATYFHNSAINANKTYGLDGALTAWRKESDADGDATIEAGEGDHVYVYVGMRRGGASYYAINATNRSSPKLMWQITGGTGEYLDLAQTWSGLKLTKVKWGCAGDGTGCTDKYVLVFAGGYDAVHDTATVPTTGDGGAGIFMVDATTGQLLWSAGRPVTPVALHDLELSTMQNSIPGDVTLADIDSDGFLDTMFAVDITGRIFRFDVNSAPTAAANFATGGVIARLGDWDTNSANNTTNFRRFYYAPDVAYFAPRGSRAFLAISVASGYRAHPKDTVVDDKIYSVFDPNVFSPPKNALGNIDYSSLDPSDTIPLDERDLFDATTTPANKFTNAPHGWYKRLQGADEKGLSSPSTFAGALVFTTYLPPDTATAVCGLDIGTGRVYVIDALTGVGLIPDGTAFDEYLTLVHSGIPPAPSIVYTDDSVTWTDDDGDTHTNQQTQPIVCVGTECFDDLLPTDDPLLRTFWRENQ